MYVTIAGKQRVEDGREFARVQAAGRGKLSQKSSSRSRTKVLRTHSLNHARQCGLECARRVRAWLMRSIQSAR